MDCVGQFMEKDIVVFRGQEDRLVRVVRCSIDARSEPLILDPHAEPLGYVHERRRVSRLVDGKWLPLRVLEPKDGHWYEPDEDICELFAGISGLQGCLPLDPLPDRPEDVDGLGSFGDRAPSFHPLPEASRVRGPREEHEELISKGPL